MLKSLQEGLSLLSKSKPTTWIAIEERRYTTRLSHPQLYSQNHPYVNKRLFLQIWSLLTVSRIQLLLRVDVFECLMVGKQYKLLKKKIVMPIATCSNHCKKFCPIGRILLFGRINLEVADCLDWCNYDDTLLWSSIDWQPKKKRKRKSNRKTRILVFFRKVKFFRWWWLFASYVALWFG